jgi:hypothetical protein
MNHDVVVMFDENAILLKKRITELEVEVERLKETTKRIPELTWRASQHIAVCDVLKEPRGADIVGRVESILSEWNELRAHSWQQERAAVVALLRDPSKAQSIFNSIDLLTAAHWIEVGDHWPGGEKG